MADETGCSCWTQRVWQSHKIQRVRPRAQPETVPPASSTHSFPQKITKSDTWAKHGGPRAIDCANTLLWPVMATLRRVPCGYGTASGAVGRSALWSFGSGPSGTRRSVRLSQRCGRGASIWSTPRTAVDLLLTKRRDARPQRRGDEMNIDTFRGSGARGVTSALSRRSDLRPRHPHANTINLGRSSGLLVRRAP
jgi:hypothetical protein